MLNYDWYQRIDPIAQRVVGPLFSELPENVTSVVESLCSCGEEIDGAFRALSGALEYRVPIPHDVLAAARQIADDSSEWMHEVYAELLEQIEMTA